MVNFNDLRLPQAYDGYKYMTDIINDAIKFDCVNDIIGDIFNIAALRKEFTCVALLAIYFAYKKENPIVANAIERIVFNERELLEKYHFPFFFLNDEAIKNVEKIIEKNHHNHIKLHLRSIDDPMIENIDSPREDEYEKNFMHALKLKGDENRRIVIKKVGNYGVIVGAFIGSSNNKHNKTNEILKVMYRRSERALITPFSNMKSIDGWLGFAMLAGYNDTPYFNHYKLEESVLAECLNFD